MNLDSSVLETRKMKDFYEICKPSIEKKFSKYKGGRRTISYNDFARVIYSYFEVLMEDVYKGRIVPFLGSFGLMYGVKVRGDIYGNEVKYYSRKEGKYITKKYPKTDDYFYYVLWDRPKSFLGNKIKTAKRIKGKMYKLGEFGNVDYLDASVRADTMKSVRKIREAENFYKYE